MDRIGIPDLYLNDGPQGFRGIPGTSTAWPSGLAQASTWNPKLVEEMAIALSHEFKEKGANVILGPGKCMLANGDLLVCGGNSWIMPDSLWSG